MAKFTINGMVNIVIRLLKAVRETESAKSALAIKLIKLEVGPPGQAAKIITPIAISGCTGNTVTTPKPINGKKIN